VDQAWHDFYPATAGKGVEAAGGQEFWLGWVLYEPNCVVGDDPGEIVRHAAPLDERARAQLREQQIARMRLDPAAIVARERRVAIERAPAGRVLHARFACRA
jgi:hypothetical protein